VSTLEGTGAAPHAGEVLVTGGLTRRMVLALGLLMVVIAGAFSALLLAIADLRDSASAARDTREELIALDAVDKLGVDLETGLRGFIITREARFLSPWNEARAALPERADVLERLVAENADQLRRARAITRAVRSYIHDYGRPLLAAARRGDTSARSVAVTEEGRRRIDALGAQVGRFRATERAIITERQERADAAARRAVVAGFAGLAGSVVLLGLIAAYLMRAIVGPVLRAAAMADRLAGGDLATRMPTTGVGEIGLLERSFNVMARSLEDNRDELAELAAEQAALRRVATLVARGAPPPEVFSAVAEEMAQRLGANVATVLRYEADGTATVVGGWSPPGTHIPIGTRLRVAGVGVAVSVLHTRRPARVERFEGPPGSVADFLRSLGVHSSVGSPIVVEDTLWGVAIVAAERPEALSPGSEERIAEFTELVATAIANAEGRAELAASRARIVATADETRRRLERDLHDGAQQRLVSLALRLRAAAGAIPPDLGDVHEELGAIVEELDEVLADLREISRGIHPAILSEGGLGPALRTLARRSSVAVKLRHQTDARLPDRVEVAAYYVVSEALTNVAKHASASVVEVDVDARDGRLLLAIRDDGVGGADPTRGSGLIGLKDRVEATGGTMTVESPVGKGTSIAVELPIDGGV
jgi:signal transduction histidine kinase